MTTKTTGSTAVAAALKVSWVPLAIIVLAQLQMGININALPVSLGPIVEDLNAPATSISTALVLYSLFVAAFVMLGAKIGKMFGERLVFQVSAVGHGAAMALMAISTDAGMMNIAQSVAGIAAALLVPTLVVLLAANYHGRQQEQSLGILASIPAVASGLTFVIAGYIATAFSWRISFGLIFVISLAVLLLSFRMKSVPRQKGISIDGVGVVLSALAIALILFGFNNLNTWGIVVATPAAPFSILGLSPVPFMLLLGVVLGQAFFAWSERRVSHKKTPLLALEVLDTSEERNAVYAFLVAGGLSSAISFLIPLYIQIVQGQTPFFTSIAIVPYAITVAAAAILSVRLYDRLTPRRLGLISFVLIGAGMGLLAFTIGSDLEYADGHHRADPGRPGRRHDADPALQCAGLCLAQGAGWRCGRAARRGQQCVVGAGRCLCRRGGGGLALPAHHDRLYAVESARVARAGDQLRPYRLRQQR